MVFLSLSTMCLTWPAKYIASSMGSHLFQLPSFSTGTVKVQLAGHPLAEGGTRVVAFQLLGDVEVVDMVALLVVEALAVFVTEGKVADACGCAVSFAMIDTDVMLTRHLLEYSHNQPAAAPYAPNNIVSGNHMVFIFIRDNGRQANLVENPLARALHISAANV